MHRKIFARSFTFVSQYQNHSMLSYGQSYRMLFKLLCLSIEFANVDLIDFFRFEEILGSASNFSSP